VPWITAALTLVDEDREELGSCCLRDPRGLGMVRAEPSAALIAEAKVKPGGWVYEILNNCGPDLVVPHHDLLRPEGCRGWASQKARSMDTDRRHIYGCRRKDLSAGSVLIFRGLQESRFHGSRCLSVIAAFVSYWRELLRHRQPPATRLWVA
jgi:hypothetical protein